MWFIIHSETLRQGEVNTAHTLLAHKGRASCTVPCYPHTSAVDVGTVLHSKAQIFPGQHPGRPRRMRTFLLPSSFLNLAPPLLPALDISSHLPFILPALQGCSLPTSACTTRDFPFLSPTNPMGKLLANRRKGSSLCKAFLDLDIWPGPALWTRTLQGSCSLSWTQSWTLCSLLPGGQRCLISAAVTVLRIWGYMSQICFSP